MFIKIYWVFPFRHCRYAFTLFWKTFVETAVYTNVLSFKVPFIFLRYQLFLCHTENDFWIFSGTKFGRMFAKIKIDECLHQIVVSMIFENKKSYRIGSISQLPVIEHFLRNLVFIKRNRII